MVIEKLLKSEQDHLNNELKIKELGEQHSNLALNYHEEPTPIVMTGKGKVSKRVMESLRLLKRLTSITSFGKRFPKLMKQIITYIKHIMTTEGLKNMSE